MLRFYETTDNLGSAFVNNLLFQSSVDILSSPSAQFDVQTGYTNISGDAGQLVVTNNEMVFNSGDPVTPLTIGLYILFSSDKAQQITVNVTDVTTITTVSIAFVLSSITNTLFDPVETALAITGGDKYRCVAIQNDDSTLEFQTGLIWVLTQVFEGSVSIGLDPSGVNGTPAASDGDTSPIGVTFSAPITEGTGLTIPTLTAGDHVFLWLKRTNPVNTSDITFRLTLDMSGVYV